MDASGVIESELSSLQQPPPPATVDEPILSVEFIPKSTEAPNTNSRYRRLAESRSITPSPTPLMKDSLENGPPVITRGSTLSPIASSPDSSPVAAPAKQSPLKPKLLSVPVPNILSSVVSRRHKNGNYLYDFKEFSCY